MLFSNKNCLDKKYPCFILPACSQIQAIHLHHKAVAVGVMEVVTAGLAEVGKTHQNNKMQTLFKQNLGFKILFTIFGTLNALRANVVANSIF